MRVSNAYHKWQGDWEQRNGKVYDELLRPFRFDYVVESNRGEIKNLFVGFEYKGNSTQLITQDYRVRELTTNDRIWIDGEKSSITAITDTEENNLGGQRFTNRKKTYLIELEKR